MPPACHSNPTTTSIPIYAAIAILYIGDKFDRKSYRKPLPDMVFSAYMCQEIEIAASPEEVRAQFLDFGNLLRYSTNLFRSIRPKRAGDAEPIDGVEAKPGDTLTIATSTGLAPRVEAEVVENTPAVFKYKHSESSYTAVHWFEFNPHPNDPKITLLKQCQTAEGIAACMFWSLSPLRWFLDGKFAGFNEDLQRAVESKHGGTSDQ